MDEWLDIRPEVAQALAAGRPVVALESTIISHGLPHPANLEMAVEVEGIIRAAGAVPATIAVLDGRCRVGLTATELQRLATDAAVVKVSLRDLPVVLATGQTGATTVAATVTIADAAGVKVFVTGGIGGVHRAAPGEPGPVWDVSADVTALARCRTAVVCAGAKTVLDIPATLEMLETLGVTVVGYGTDRFPGFYVRETEGGVDVRADTPAAVAAIIRARRATGVPGSVLVANPIPAEAALDAAELNAHLDQAMADMAAAGVTGKDVTPYLLDRLRQATAGRSLAANLALIRNNARLGAQVAGALAEG